MSHWGYAPDEALTPEEMLKVKYEGIRPAPGYPTQPDHTEKTFMWELLKADKEAGIVLTDSLAMLPAASVSALCFANECSTYFQVGKVCKDQITDYAKRKVDAPPAPLPSRLPFTGARIKQPHLSPSFRTPHRLAHGSSFIPMVVEAAGQLGQISQMCVVVACQIFCFGYWRAGN